MEFAHHEKAEGMSPLKLDHQDYKSGHIGGQSNSIICCTVKGGVVSTMAREAVQYQLIFLSLFMDQLFPIFLCYFDIDILQTEII